MINSLKNKLMSKSLLEKQLRELEMNAKSIRSNSDILVLCPENYGSNWLGVKNATQTMFEDILFFPHSFSTSIFSGEQLVKFSELIQHLDFTQIIFSGLPHFFTDIILELKRKKTQTKIKVIYHGTLSELSGNDRIVESFKSLIELRQKLSIDQIGFVNSDLRETFHALYAVQSSHLIPVKKGLQKEKSYTRNEIIQIGCFGNSSFNKNIHNQIAGSLICPGTHVNTFPVSGLEIYPENRITVHSHMSHNSFVSTLGSMDLNTYVSFSESWGQIITESISQGVPCITGVNNTVYNENAFLKDKLSILKIDNPIEISLKIKAIEQNLQSISSECIIYYAHLENLSDNLLNNFIHD